MQKVLSLLLLTLTASCAFGLFVEKNYAKLPVSVGNESFSGVVELKSLASDDLSLTETKFVVVDRFDSSKSYWSLWRRTLDSKNLSIISTKNYTFYAGEHAHVIIYNGYAVEFVNENTATGGFRIMVKQTDLEKNVTLPAFPLTDDNYAGRPYLADNSTYTYGDSIFVSIKLENATNFTSFKVGGSSVNKTITVNVPNYFGAVMIKGGMLTESQMLVATSYYHYNLTLSEILLDFSDGTSKINTRTISYPLNYSQTLDCQPYVTYDSFGSVCVSEKIIRKEGWNMVYLNHTFDYYFTKDFSDLQEIFSKDVLSEGVSNVVRSTFISGNQLILCRGFSYGYDLFSKFFDYQIWDIEKQSFTTSLTTFIGGLLDPQAVTLQQAANGNILSLFSYQLYRNTTELRVGIVIDNTVNTTKSFFDDEDEKVDLSFLA